MPPHAMPFGPLREFLSQVEAEEITLTFTDLEALLGTPLPDGAWLRAWWVNTGSAQAAAWRAAGWRVRWVRRQADEAAVTFVRQRGR